MCDCERCLVSNIKTFYRADLGIFKILLTRRHLFFAYDGKIVPEWDKQKLHNYHRADLVNSQAAKEYIDRESANLTKLSFILIEPIFVNSNGAIFECDPETKELMDKLALNLDPEVEKSWKEYCNELGSD